jgi:hypothetical protein
MAAGLVVNRRERAPARGADAEDLKEVPRYERALHPLTVDPSIDLRRHRKCIGEHARLADERFVLQAREAFGLRVGRSRALDREQLVRVVYLVDAKDECVEEREHDGHQAEAERHCRHNRQGHERCPAERATGVEHVPHDAVEESRGERTQAHGVDCRP